MDDKDKSKKTVTLDPAAETNRNAGTVQSSTSVGSRRLAPAAGSNTQNEAPNAGTAQSSTSMGSRRLAPVAESDPLNEASNARIVLSSPSSMSRRQAPTSERNPQNEASSPEMVLSSTSSVGRRLNASSSRYIEDDAYSMKNEISNFLNRIDSSEDLKNYPGAERSEFDFMAERRNVYTTNLVESAAHLFKGMLGVGILSMHEAYMHGGTITGLATTCVLGLFGPYNTLMLVRTAQKTYHRARISKMTYADLMETAVAKGPMSIRKFRKCGRYTVDGFLTVSMCNTCNVYQIMMALTIQKVMEVFAETQLDVRLYILMVTLPLIGLCAIKRLKILARLSIVGDVFIVICVVIALCYAFQDLPPISERATWVNLQEFFGFTGILIYSIDSITLALPIENNMTRPTMFPVVAWIAIPIVLIFSTLVGFFGYWRWGNTCISPIIFHLPMTVGFLILCIMFAIVLALTFSVQFWIPFKILWRYQKKRIKKNRDHWETFDRILLLLILTIISVIFPHIKTLIALIGNVYLGFITFIFPPIIEYFITYKDKISFFKRFLNLLSVFVGIFVVSGGVYAVM